MNRTNRAVLLGLVAAFVMLACETYGSPPEAVGRIRKHTTSSDELSYVLYVSDRCGVNRQTATTAVEGVMIRSRITPNYGINSDHMTLVDCQSLTFG